MNTLPKYYYFKNDINHPKLNIIKERFNNLYNNNIPFNYEAYYGYGYDYRCYFSKESFGKDAVEITMDQFLEMTEPHKTWTIEEFNKGKVIIEFDNTQDSVELLNQIYGLKSLKGLMKYYWKNSEYSNGNYSLKRIPNLPICSINDIIFDSKQTNMDKNLLGYKPKPTTDWEWLKGFTACVETVWENIIKNGGYMSVYSTLIENARKAGVLDIWFDKVYEEDKKKKVFDLDAYSGRFQLEVNKDGIYYSPERVRLDVAYLQRAVKGANPDFLLEGRSEDNGLKRIYKVEYTHITLGCKKYVPIKQLKEVVDYYNSIK